MYRWIKWCFIKYTINVDNSSTINYFETDISFYNVYKNENTAKDREKKTKINTGSNIQLLNNENASEFKNESKINSIFLADHLTADNRKRFYKYKQFKFNFQRFWKTFINDQIQKFIKKLKISNLLNDSKN